MEILIIISLISFSIAYALVGFLTWFLFSVADDLKDWNSFLVFFGWPIAMYLAYKKEKKQRERNS